MQTAETTLLILLTVLALGLIVPEFFKKLRIPYVSSLILIGAVIGPYGFNYLPSNQVVEFFGFLGMAFLMFMTGFETDISQLKKVKAKLFIMAACNGLIPFATGFLIAWYFGYGLFTSMLLGIVFISSSVALIIPSLKAAKIFDKQVGQLILSAVLVMDIFSLFMLSFVLQSVDPITKLPLVAYYIVLLVSIAAIVLLLPRLTKFLLKRKIFSSAGHEEQLRFVIVVMISVLTYFSLLGVHPILAAFIVGLVLSGNVKSKVIYTKLHTLGYGIFVPVFFVIVGTQLNMSMLYDFDTQNVVMLVIVFGLLISKVLSGMLGGWLARLSLRDSSLFGISSTIHLTTTLAVTYAAANLGILDSTVTSSIIVISVVTTILAPIVLKFILGAARYDKIEVSAA